MAFAPCASSGLARSRQRTQGSRLGETGEQDELGHGG